MALFIALPAAALLLAAGAPDAAAPLQQKSANPNDPNKIICEKQEVLGSRLATRRVCKTRAQWADERLQDRQDIEKAQTQIGSMTH